MDRLCRTSGRPARPVRPPPLLRVVLAALIVDIGSAWNSFTTVSQLYSFQELYTDAQYGPDFGYYYTGRILHSDGPADNGGAGDEDAGQDWFNSYTTLPMSLSPFFAHTLCDRFATMWEAMERPSPIVIAEFGGGTGMLARDVLRRARDTHPDFFAALAKYVIGERSMALRAAQTRTAAEFVATGKLAAVSADGRHAAELRPVLEEAVGLAGGQHEPVVGFILSNELLDEFDPVRLRLVWHKHHVPSAARCASCQAYREAFVLHSVDAPALRALLRHTAIGHSTASLQAEVEAIAFEGSQAMCGLLNTPALQFAAASVAMEMTFAEQQHCAPAIVCCFPFVIAVDQALQYSYDALSKEKVSYRPEADGVSEMARIYRHHLQRMNGTVPLTKERYRELRRLAAARGPEVEKALLAGGIGGADAAAIALLPGRIWSQEVFLALTPARCRELEGWMRRGARRLAAAANLREATNPLFEGEPQPPKTQVHMKLVVRPGEAAFAEQTGKLIDEGFMMTMDYGADADALIWQQVIRPNYEGIQIIDSREENFELCTARSYLECPGLQDLTTSVDFTEMAVAGEELGGWAVRAYGPLLFLELGLFDPTTGEAGHFVDRAGGIKDANLQAWYRRPEPDPWAGFKLLVQHRGARGADWRLGPLADEWRLSASPRLFRHPSPCWARDLTKPPLASLITTAAQNELVQYGWGVYAEEAAEAASPTEAAAILAELESEPPEEEGEVVMDSVHRQFIGLLLQRDPPLAQILEAQHALQQTAYNDMHLALVLADYWMSLDPGLEPADRLAQTRQLATQRSFDILYSEPEFERVFRELSRLVFVNSTLSGENEFPPYICMAARAVHGRCCSRSREVEDRETLEAS